MDINEILKTRVGFGKANKQQLFFIFLIYSNTYSTLRCTGISASMLRNEQDIDMLSYTFFVFFIVVAAIFGSILTMILTQIANKIQLINVVAISVLLLSFLSLLSERFVTFAFIRIIQFTLMQILIVSCQPIIADMAHDEHHNYYFVLLYMSLSIGSVIPVVVAQSCYHVFGYGNWRYMIFIVSCIYTIPILFSLCNYVESPKSLLSQQKIDEAIKTMNDLGIQNNQNFKQIDKDELHVIHTLTKRQQNLNIKSIFKNKWKLFTLILLKLTLQIHLLINFFYLPQILKTQYYDSVWYDYIALYLCFIGQIIGCLITFQLIETKIGRKFTVIIFSILMCLTTGLLQIYNKFDLLFFLFFQSLQAQILLQSYGVVTNELYSCQQRSMAFAFTATMGRCIELLVPFVLCVFDVITPKLVFLIFMPINFLTAVLFLFFIPETKYQNDDQDDSLNYDNFDLIYV